MKNGKVMNINFNNLPLWGMDHMLSTLSTASMSVTPCGRGQDGFFCVLRANGTPLGNGMAHVRISFATKKNPLPC